MDSWEAQKENTMTGRLDTIGENGLQFYSKISASMSHDIKNTLAIINENAGLLDDFILMADQGVSIKPERLKTMAAMITRQVGRANEIAKNMSRLAHSLDLPVCDVNLNETLQLFTALTSRLSKMRNVSMGISESSDAVTVETSPFFLMTLIWYLLDCTAAAGDVASITLAAENREDGARVVLRLEGNTCKLREILAAKKIDGLLNLLNAELTSESGSEQFSLNLPARLDTLKP
jgi:signal transduction histidine kinase